MTESTTRRRGRGEDAIYFDETKNRYVGAVSLGFGPDGKRIRRKVTGRTKHALAGQVSPPQHGDVAGRRPADSWSPQRPV
jgi:hypothetical protein